MKKNRFIVVFVTLMAFTVMLANPRSADADFFDDLLNPFRHLDRIFDGEFPIPMPWEMRRTTNYQNPPAYTYTPPSYTYTNNFNNSYTNSFNQTQTPILYQYHAPYIYPTYAPQYTPYVNYFYQPNVYQYQSRPSYRMPPIYPRVY